MRVEGSHGPDFEPSVPGTARGKKPCCVRGTENLIEVQERPQDDCLVVVEVGA